MYCINQNINYICKVISNVAGTLNNKTMRTPKTIDSLKNKLESIKKLQTADKISKAFKESTELDFNFDFYGKWVYAGNDTIRIYVDGSYLFEVTYEKAILF